MPGLPSKTGLQWYCSTFSERGDRTGYSADQLLRAASEEIKDRGYIVTNLSALAPGKRQRADPHL
jgi:hypothetical protein